MRMTKSELLEVTGGAITAAFLNAIARGISVILDAGRSVGTAIRRIGSNSICPL